MLITCCIEIFLDILDQVKYIIKNNLVWCLFFYFFNEATGKF